MNRSFLGKKLLIFTAHPDDESYLVAGTIFKNHLLGGQTVLVCASLGERGISHLEKPLSSNRVKQLRKKELRSAARFLSISKLYTFDLPDGKISTHKKVLLRKGLNIARRYKPDFILSFGPDGISGHRDHIATGQVAKAIAQKLKIPFIAFALPPQIQEPGWLNTRRKVGRYTTSLRIRKSNFRVAIETRIKKKALHYHRSQMDNMNAFTGFPPSIAKEFLKAEYFIV